MKKWAVNFMRSLVIFFGLFCSFHTYAETPVLSAYDQMIGLMNKHYFDESYSGLDWPKLTKDTRTQIIAEENSEKKYQLIKDLFSNLKHSHLVFSSPTDKKPSIPTGPPKDTHFDIELVENQWTISKVSKDSNAWQAGLRPGMIVTSINKWQIVDEFQTDDPMSYYLLRNMLHYFPKNKISLKVQSADKKDLSIDFKLDFYSGNYQKMGLIRDPSEFEAKLLPGNVGYIRFSIFLVKPVQQAIQAIKKFRDQKVKGMIIDLRNNPGGVALLATAIAKEFCSKDYSLGTQKGRSMTLKFPVFSQTKAYKGPLVLLVNKNSASTSEVLAAGMQCNKRVKVIGQKSAGMALPSVMVSLKDGSIFQYPIADFKTEDQKTIEGIGVIPDIYVSHSHQALKNSQDLYISKAIEFINKEHAQ